LLSVQIGESTAASDDLVAGGAVTVFITPRDSAGGLIFYPVRTDFNVSINRTDAAADLFSAYPDLTLNGYHTSANPPRIMFVARTFKARACFQHPCACAMQCAYQLPALCARSRPPRAWFGSCTSAQAHRPEHPN
jgi:hypothetical protein